MLFFVLCRLVEEHRKQHGEHHRLNKAEQKAQDIHYQRQTYREQAEQCVRCKLLAVDVAVKSQCHGYRPCYLLKYHDREKYRNRLKEGQKITAQAVLFDALRLDKYKRDDRKRRRYCKHRGRHGENVSRSGQQSAVVTNDDQNKECGKYRKILPCLLFITDNTVS